ncbi:MAG: hypothetical protein HC908_00695 [Calothrix sp. SM1_7_51]|nr:hypothetical protein [Calothrix sp. SM1_7_51]
MNIRKEVQQAIEQLKDEQLSMVLEFAIFLKSKEKATTPMVESQAYQEWLSTENDIYDELFADELQTR